MRREFILVLLGIICISTISSLFGGLSRLQTNKVLLDTVIGSVEAGNFSYWQLGHFGPLIIELTSVTGDADIYIANHNQPSYELDEHSFSSATCGEDVVYIPSEFPRPLGIAVFGHWSSSISEYTIHVFLDTSVELTDLEKRLLFRKHQYHVDTLELERNKEKAAQNAEEENKPRFLKFLGILDMIFEMFLMIQWNSSTARLQ